MSIQDKIKILLEAKGQRGGIDVYFKTGLSDVEQHKAEDAILKAIKKYKATFNGYNRPGGKTHLRFSVPIEMTEYSSVRDAIVKAIKDVPESKGAKIEWMTKDKGGYVDLEEDKDAKKRTYGAHS